MTSTSRILSLALCPQLLGAVALVGGMAQPGLTAAQPAARELQELSGPALGGRYRILIGDPTGLSEGGVERPAPDLVGVASEIDDFFADFDRRLSTYRSDSVLMRFNRSSSTAWQSVDPATARLVAQSLAISLRTDGAFDPTVGPVTRAWFVGPQIARVGGARRLAPPSPEAAALLQTQVGAWKLAVRLAPPALRKRTPHIEVDLSGVAPGSAVDRLSELLTAAGFGNHLIDVGGEVRARGRRPDGAAWRAAIEQPAPPFDAGPVVPLVDVSLATSGDYRRTASWAGRRVSHVIDPRTGEPILARGRAVSVLAAQCAEADSLATALLAMGEDAGRRWAIEHDVAALFQQRRGTPKAKGPGVDVQTTAAWDRIVETAGAAPLR